MPVDRGGYTDDDDFASSSTSKRSLDGFWLVWQEGMDWPERFYSGITATEHAKTLAKRNIGRAVYVCILQEVGMIVYPATPCASGVMIE